MPSTDVCLDTPVGPAGSVWPRSALAVGFLLTITLAFYHKLWLPDLVLIKRDALRFFLPLKQYLYERLVTGELPQWFPYEGLGRSFIGVTHTGVFHPFTILYFLLPVPDAYRTSVLLSCVLAALGAFLLGRALNFSRAGALLAGVAFALSGYVVSISDNLVYLYSICLLPLFCVALHRALACGRVWLIAPAAMWTTVFLNGDVQTGYYYGFIALAWALARPQGSRREACLRVTLAGGLAVLLASVQLGPSATVFVGSDRVQSEQFQKETMYWSTHPLRLVAMVASPLAENADPVDIGRFFFGTPRYGVWADSLYLGIPVIGLALLGVRHRPDLRMLATIGVLALLLSLGRFGGLYEVFNRVVPLWSAFRFPEKLMGIVAFAVAILAGAGADALRDGKGRLRPWLAVTVLCVSAWLGLRTEIAGELVSTTFGAPLHLASAMTESASHAFFFSALAAFGIGVAVLGARKGWLRAPLLLVAMMTITALDLTRANHGAYRTGPAEAAMFTPPFVEAIAAREGAAVPGHFRLLSMRNASYVAPRTVQRLFGYDADIVERRQALDLEHNAQFHLEAFYALLPGFNTTFAAMFKQPVGVEVAARYNVAYYIGSRSLLADPRNAKGTVALLPEYNLALFKNPVPVTPRVYLSKRPERTATPVDPVALFARPDFLSGEVDVLEPSDETFPEPAASGLAVIERYTPEEVRVRVDTPQPAGLILLDAFDKGWRALLDSDKPVPILRANVLVRAVVVPAGTHSVTFRYETPLLRAGAMASLAGGTICLALIVHACRRPRKSQSAT